MQSGVENVPVRGTNKKQNNFNIKKKMRRATYVERREYKSRQHTVSPDSGAPVPVLSLFSNERTISY